MKLFIFCLCLTFFGDTSALSGNYGVLNLGLKFINCEHKLSRNLNLDVSGINVHFYDFKNDITEVFPIKKAAKGILSLKKLDKAKELFMLVGGFKSTITNNTKKLVKETFKSISNSHLIIIDHSAYTNDMDGQKKSYERSVKYTYYIGQQLAQMLAGLHKGGISAKNIHCIGHSLGSQILGHVGENFIKVTGQKISRITALDPAGPCFSKSVIQEQVRSGVADYVEVYHCNAGGLGTITVVGDVDFFLNDGGSQPHCRTRLMPKVFNYSISASCSHQTCVTMWMASVTHPDWFMAYKCDKYKDFKNGKCSHHDKTSAGFWNHDNAKGVYYLSTKNSDFINNL